VFPPLPGCPHVPALSGVSSLSCGGSLRAVSGFSVLIRLCGWCRHFFLFPRRCARGGPMRLLLCPHGSSSQVWPLFMLRLHAAPLSSPFSVPLPGLCLLSCSRMVSGGPGTVPMSVGTCWCDSGVHSWRLCLRCATQVGAVALWCVLRWGALRCWSHIASAVFPPQ
jgi:hypothetical protein